MARRTTRCADCPKRGQCDDCRGWDETVDRLADGLSRKVTDALVDRGYLR